MSTQADSPRGTAQEGEERFQALVESVEDIVFTTDADFRLTGVFGRWLERMSRRPEEFLGRSVEDLALGALHEIHLRAMRQALDGDSQTYEWIWPVTDGTYRIMHTSVSRMCDREGLVTGLVGITRDITELKMTQERHNRLVGEVDRIRFEWAETLDVLPEVVALVDREGRVLRCNRAIESLDAGLTQRAVGQNLHVALHPLCREADCYLASGLKRAAGEAMTELPDEVEAYDRVLDRRIRLRFRPIRGRNGSSASGMLVAILEDLSEQRRFEDQLRQAQKLESIGQLAAGIAHEINTPTQYVGDNLTFLRDSFRDILGLVAPLISASTDTAALDPAVCAGMCRAARDIDLSYLSKEVPLAIEQAIDGVGRVGTIVRAMKAFSHPGPTEPTPVDIHQAIRNTATVARNRWKYVATLDMEFDPDLPFVPCVPGEFNQVMLNLIVNAADSIAEAIQGDETRKGVITIRTRLDGDWAEIRVIDTGTGVPEQIRQRLFEPFFTTKQVGQGSGQGLSLCHAIVAKKHRGALTFETEAGGGSSFIVRLPLASSVVAPPAVPASPRKAA
jgi:PAS domain S-box-containing protein